MATATWSVSLPTGTYSGTTWQSYTLTGSALPAGAVISNVEYSLTGYIGKYTTGSYKFNLYAIAVQNGPYTTTSYSSSSATTLTGTIAAKTSSGGAVNSYSFENGTAEVWRYSSSRTYCELTDCDFKNKTTTTAFNSSSINVKLRFNSTLSGTTYITAISVKVTYSLPTLSKPGTPTITQNMDGTYKASWTAATGSGGSGNVTYRLYSVSDGAFISSASTSLSYTGTISKYNYNCQFRVYAYYGSLSTYSSTASKTFNPPSLSTPTLTATINADTSLKLTWTAATLSYTTGNVAYSVYVGSSVYSSGLAATTITVPAATLEGWGTGDYVFKVVATATSLSNTSQGSTLSKTSGTYTYSYVAPVTANIIAYFNGSSWVNCEVYYYNGSSWVLCEPYYYDGTKWVACSTV